MTTAGVAVIGKALAWRINTVRMPAALTRGACANHPNPEIWFPLFTQDPRVRVAREYCRRCPVLTTCRDYADAQPRGTIIGIWGARLFRNGGAPSDL